MFKRDWGNGFAIGVSAGGFAAIFLLVWIIGLNYCPGEPCRYSEAEIGQPMPGSKPHEPVGQPSTTNRQPTEQSPEKSEMVLGVTPADPSRNLHNKSPSEGSDYQGEDPYFPIYGDGGAQWLMAILTAVATLVSAWAVLLVRKSLQATNLALVEAKTANNISREIGEAQVRAYLTIENVRVTPRQENDRIFWDMVITVSNTGQSPAMRINATAFVGIASPMQVGGKIRPISSGSTGDLKLIASTAFKELTFAQEESRATFFAVLSISYRDVFMADHVMAMNCAGFINVLNGSEVTLSVFADQ